ncbi:CHASE domain-containing protein [Deinococcus sp.]|uniref:CHASE domain-containing protein n=1 Tax=Deinococcus sp. TaxID=47478 RepID=UPI003C7ED4BC
MTESPPPASPASASPFGRPGGNGVPGLPGAVQRLRTLFPAPLWVLLLVLLLTVLASATVRQLVKQQQTARFEREVTAYQRDLRQRFQGYAGLLIAVRASWEAVAAVQQDQKASEEGPSVPALALSLQQFERLARGLDLGTRYPGLSSLGYAPLVTARARARFARQLPLLAGDPAVGLHPSSSLARSAPVVYLAPAGGNRSVLGYDMYTDAVRRRAIEGAVTSGEIRSTGQLTLLNLPLNDPDRDGLILYLPVREAGRVSGLLYAPLQISAVLPPQSATNQIALKISLDGQGLIHRVGSGAAARPQAPPDFQQTEVLNLAGQDWTLAFSAPPGFGQDAAANIPWLVLAVGTLVALLAALATQAQVYARVRAERVSRSLSLSQSRLERSRAEFEAVFRAMQDTAVFTDPSGRVLFANDALRDSFGLSPFELRGTRLEELHADSRLTGRLDALPGPHLVTTLFRRRGGGGAAPLFYGEMQRSRVVGEGGETLGHLEVIRDVSERLQADHALREGERRYQGVLEGLPQIVFLTDAAGRVGYLNRRWWEYAGAPPSPATTGSEGAPDWSGEMLRAIHPDDRADFSRRWQEALLSGRELEIEHRLRSESGAYRTFMTRGRPVQDAKGRMLEWVGSSTDIDDQIYAEANARLLADVGQALSDRHLSAEGVSAATDPDVPATTDSTATEPPANGEEFWQADSGLRQALGLMTLRFADSAALWPGHQSLRAAPLLAGRVRRTGLNEQLPLERLNEAVFEVMYRHEPAVYHGRRLHALGLSSAVLMPLSRDDQPLGVLGLGFRQPLQDRDLELARELGQRLTSALDNRTLLARLHAAQGGLQDLNDSLEQRVNERTVQLSEANDELEAFSYSVSHDLRTPLRHIMGFADLLARETAKASAGEAAAGVAGAGVSSAGIGSPKAARYLGIITESAGRMSRLIDDLLEFSRTSRAELRRHPVDLERVVQGALQGLAPDVHERQVEWQVGPLPTVVGDAGLLRQVFDNLLSNALKYTRTREHAVIEVAAQQQEREVWLSVRDNGVGFDPEYAGKLFGVFQRLHRDEDFEGTGIGLANVRRIVARHGGRVWAESGDLSRPGATFWLALPLEPLSLEKLGLENRGGGERRLEPGAPTTSAEDADLNQGAHS